MNYIKCSQAYASSQKSGEVLYKQPNGKVRVKLRSKESVKSKPRGTQWFVRAGSNRTLVDSIVDLQLKIKELEAQLGDAKAVLSQDAEAYESINCGNPPYKVSSANATATVSFVKKITLKTTADEKSLLLRKIVEEKPVEYVLCSNMNKVVGDILTGNYIQQDLNKYLASVEREFGVSIARKGCPSGHFELQEYLAQTAGLSEGAANEVATEILLVKNYEGIRRMAKKCGCSVRDFINLITQSFDVATHSRVMVAKKNVKT